MFDVFPEESGHLYGSEGGVFAITLTCAGLDTTCFTPVHVWKFRVHIGVEIVRDGLHMWADSLVKDPHAERMTARAVADRIAEQYNGVEALAKRYDDLGFTVQVWYKEIREEYYVWNYKIVDDDGVRDPNKLREYFWSRSTHKLTLEQVADMITDFITMVG